MTITKIAAVVRSNVPKQSITKEVMKKLTEYFAKRYATDAANVVVECYGEVKMMRGGTTDPMLNMDVFHNSDKITQDTKHTEASDVAAYTGDVLGVPVERILVLYFDTRKCT